MTTTIMRDSMVGDEWIARCCQAVPVQRVIDQKTGNPTNDILTGPVRLAFVDSLFELQAPSAQVPNPKHGAAVLFTPYTDFTLFYDEYHRICAREFPEHYDAASGQYYGLHSPFRDQGEKLKFGGFTPGLTFMSCTSKFKPPIVDQNYNPIVDKKRVYAGVWAILGLNCYAFKDPRKKGVGFGLQSVMLIGDDSNLGSKGPDVRQQFGGVAGAIAPPAIAPGSGQGMPMGGAPGQPPANLAPPPGGTHAAPPRPAGPPGAPAGNYAAPVMPGHVPAAPPAAGDDMSFLD